MDEILLDKSVEYFKRLKRKKRILDFNTVDGNSLLNWILLADKNAEIIAIDPVVEKKHPKFDLQNQGHWYAWHAVADAQEVSLVISENDPLQFITYEWLKIEDKGFDFIFFNHLLPEKNMVDYFKLLNYDGKLLFDRNGSLFIKEKRN